MLAPRLASCIALSIMIATPIAPGEPGMPERVGGILNPRHLPRTTPTVVPQVEPDPSLPATNPARVWLVPRWIIVGILARESSSRLIDADHSIHYVDKRRSETGARGPTQIMPRTFSQFKEPGERYAHVETDMALALRVTERILVSHRFVLGSWERAIRAYRSGRGNWRSDTAGDYYEDVKALGHAKGAK